MSGQSRMSTATKRSQREQRKNDKEGAEIMREDGIAERARK
jgi:hypothetical protein